MTTDVAVIIVNYGTADMAIAAVDSVLDRAPDGLTVEVHVVDNASPGRRCQHPARNGTPPGRGRHASS